MKHQKITDFYQSVKKLRFRVESKVDSFKKRCQGDTGRNIKRCKSLGKKDDFRPRHHDKNFNQAPKLKFADKLEDTKPNESFGPDFKIYEYDDFLVSSCPVPGPPLPPRYSPSSVPPPLVRRKTQSFTHNYY